MRSRDPSWKQRRRIWRLVPLMPSPSRAGEVLRRVKWKVDRVGRDVGDLIWWRDWFQQQTRQTQQYAAI
jgi:hypothetical protein